MKRREFLQASAGLASTLVPGILVAQTKPCPPGSFSASGGTLVTDQCIVASGSLPSLVLANRGGSGALAWTFGQAFAKGDVPYGKNVVSGDPSFQSNVRNFWLNSDGTRHSVKLAILSGVSEIGAGGIKQVALVLADAADSRTDIPESRLATILGSGDVTLSFDSGVSGSASLRSLIGKSAASASGPGGAVGGGLVRSLPGPVMSEFHYMTPIDAHLCAWFFCRVYSNGQCEVETVVENGWVNVASPTRKDYSATMRINGSTVYSSGALNHYHHTRWSRVDWIGAASNIIPSHDVTYLRKTKLVPNWTFGSPSQVTVNALALTDGANPVPFAAGNWPVGGRGITAGGEPALNGFIGLGITPVAMYVASGRSEAFNSLIGHERTHGRYPIYYRDEQTLRPLAPSAYPTYGFPSNSGWYYGEGGAPNQFPNPAVDVPVDRTYDAEHHPSTGYYGYLLTGRWLFMEQCQMQASAVVRQIEYEFREPSGGTISLYGGDDGRSNAWRMRSVAQAAAISDASLIDQFAGVVSRTVTTCLNRVPENSIGISLDTGWGATYNGGDNEFDYAVFHFDFWAAVLGFVSDLELGGNDIVTLRNRAYKFVVGRCGDPATGYDYRRLHAYSVPFGSGSDSQEGATLYPTWRAVYDRYVAKYRLPPLPNDTILRQDNDEAVTSTIPDYAKTITPALAYAVDHGAPGAAAAWARLTSCQTWRMAAATTFNESPRYGITPR